MLPKKLRCETCIEIVAATDAITDNHLNLFARIEVGNRIAFTVEGDSEPQIMIEKMASNGTIVVGKLSALLRARRERPRRAAKQRDELAPLMSTPSLRARYRPGSN